MKTEQPKFKIDDIIFTQVGRNCDNPAIVQTRIVGVSIQAGKLPLYSTCLVINGTTFNAFEDAVFASMEECLAVSILPMRVNIKRN